jgi:two-component system, cell cycle sensor histidine kinase and response regulator CckA
MKSPLHILFVADDPAQLQPVEAHLQRNGSQVKCNCVTEYTDLQRALTGYTWDLLLVSQNGRDLPLEETLRVLAPYSSRLPIILLSAPVAESRVAELLQQGVWDFVFEDDLGRLGLTLIRCLRDAADRRSRREAEAALLRWADAFVNCAHGMAMVLPVTNEIMVCNPALAQMLGHATADALRGAKVLGLHEPDDHAVVRQKIGEADRAGRAHFEARMVHADGIAFPVQVDIVCVRDAAGQPSHLIATVQDITKRKAAEDALRENERFLSDLVEQSSALIFVKDLEGRYELVNRQWESVTGISREQAVGRTDRELFAGPIAEEFQQSDREVICSAGRIERVDIWDRPEGRRYFLSLIVPMHRNDGAIRGVCGTATDITARRKAEEQLRQLSRAVEQSPAIIVITDTNGIIEYVNPQFTVVTGYSPEEALGKTPRLLKSGHFTAERYKNLWQTIKRGEQWRGELHNRKKNGELFWEAASISPIIDAEGRITHFVAVKEDITAQKQAEGFRQALLQLATTLNSTADAVGAGRALLDAADKLWKWDGARLDLFADGSRQITTVLEVDTVGGCRQELPQPQRNGAPGGRLQRGAELEPQLIAPDAPATGDSPAADARPVRSGMSVPIHREHAVIGVFSIHAYAAKAYRPEDLRTLQALADYCGGALERIRSEIAHHQSEDRYRHLIETTYDLIWELDAEGRYTYASPKVSELLGYTPQEVLGKTPLDLMPEKEARRIGPILREIVQRQEPFSALENINRHKAGHEVVFETSGVPILGANGEFLGHRGMARDITERKRLEAQLRQAQKLEAVGQLAGGVAHDFNNIIAATMMHLSLLQSNPAVDMETRTALKELESEAQRAATLTRQLLAFSRRSVLAVKSLDLNEVVGNLLKMLTRLIGEHIKLSFESSCNLPLVEADAGMMEQVIINLVVNARDAMPKGGRILLGTHAQDFDAAQAGANSDRRPGSFICLAVTDTGCGMDAATLRRIFEPFFTTKEPGKGTGLGLATVHGIVAQHHGWVEVSSDVNHGTSFRVYLPKHKQAPPSAAALPSRPTIQKGRGETVLVVEDEPKVRELVAKMLRTFGYQVHEAAHGQEAMKAWGIIGHQVDLLLTDMVMPEGMTGMELVENLQAKKPGLPAIISSGYSPEMVQGGVPQRANLVYLPKPYDPYLLAKVVHDLLATRK